MNIHQAQNMVPPNAWNSKTEINIPRSYNSRIKIQMESVTNPLPFDPDDVQADAEDFENAKKSMRELVDNLTPNELRMLSRIVAETL